MSMLIFCSREKKPKIHLPVSLHLPSSSQTLAKFQPWQRLHGRDSVSDGPSRGAQLPDPRHRPPLSPRSFTSMFPSSYSCATMRFHNRFVMVRPGLQASGQAGVWDSGSASQRHTTTHRPGGTGATETTVLFTNAVRNGDGAAHLVCNSQIQW